MAGSIESRLRMEPLLYKCLRLGGHAVNVKTPDRPLPRDPGECHAPPGRLVRERGAQRGREHRPGERHCGVNAAHPRGI